MDRVLREERAYILNVAKQVKKAGCNILLVQKSIQSLNCWPIASLDHFLPEYMATADLVESVLTGTS
jgi:T-complex protein 1 subunit delta